VLCDLFDRSVEDTTGAPYPGEDVHGDEDLAGLIEDMELAWNLSPAARDAYVDATHGLLAPDVQQGIAICELASFRTLRVGSASEIEDVLTMNGMDCGW
jgi:hypothetical protein